MIHLRGVLLALLAAVASAVGAVTPAGADTIPFALLVVDGFKFQPVVVPAEPGTLVSPNRPFHAIVGGAKAPGVLGHATIALWSQTVTDPFFNPIRPLAALGVFQFDAPLSLVAHFGLIDTPAGVRTTIGVLGMNNARGTWVAGPAQGIAGAGPDDLVVGGLLVLGTPNPVPGQNFLIQPPNSAQPLSSVGRVQELNCLFGDCTGSYYGEMLLSGEHRPFRGYSMARQSLGLPAKLLHLGVIHAGGDEYVVIACGLNLFPEPSQPWNAFFTCSTSGAGGLAGLLAGQAAYEPEQFQRTRLYVYSFLALP